MPGSVVPRRDPAIGEDAGVEATEVVVPPDDGEDEPVVERYSGFRPVADLTPDRLVPSSGGVSLFGVCLVLAVVAFFVLGWLAWRQAPP